MPGSLDQLPWNPICAILHAAGVPWLWSRESLAKRFGIRQHPAHGWKVIEIATPEPLVEGLLWPLSAQVFPQFSPLLPATEFSGNIHFGDNSRENLRLTAEQLTLSLGEAQIADSANTLGRQWKFGAAALELIVWPSEMRRFPLNNPSQERFPQLTTSCYISIKTGYRKPATEQELVWLRSFIPVDRIHVGDFRVSSSAALPAGQYGLEFIREPHADLESIFGFVGRSADRGALIFHCAQLFLVPMEDVIRYRVTRILPAKGAGGSRLEVECRTH